MALNDIYELKHQARDADGRELENVYFYRHVADPVGGTSPTQAQRLAQDWNTDILTPMLPQIPHTFVTTNIRVRNLFNPADAYIMPLARTGSGSLASTELLPTFTAGVVTISHDNGFVHKGRKMLYGLTEAMQSAGLFTIVGLTSLAIRAALCVAGVSDLLGGVKAFQPVVVKRIREGAPGSYTYRLPTTQLEAIYGNVQSAVVSAIVSSQDTRKK